MLRVLGWLKTALDWWRRADAVIDTVDDFITGGENAESDRQRSYSGNAHDRRKAAREESRREEAGQTDGEREGGAVLELPSVQETGKQILSKLRGGGKAGSAGAGEKSAEGNAGAGA